MKSENKIDWSNHEFKRESFKGELEMDIFKSLK